MRPVNPLPPATRRAALATLALVVALGPVAATGAETTKPAAKAGKSCCTPAAADAAPETGGTAYQRSVEELTVPDLTLVRMDGRKVSLRDELTADTPVLVNFIFTTCTTICPVMSATFSQVQAGLGEEQKVRMVSISIDPEQDTPARLRDYAQRHEAGPDWHFLTGSVEQIDTVQKAFNAYRGNKFNHAPLTFMRMPGDPHWVRIEGLVKAEVILDEYDKLVAEL